MGLRPLSMKLLSFSRLEIILYIRDKGKIRTESQMKLKHLSVANDEYDFHTFNLCIYEIFWSCSRLCTIFKVF